jgi:putative di-trans,poly-cis-decaprenylcistransferase
MRIPKHIGIIPDGNRRWSQNQNMPKEKGYFNGIDAGIKAFKHCVDLGVKELSIYGFTVDNTKRPSVQRLAFTKACVEIIELISQFDCEILVVGNVKSKMFPQELIKYTTPTLCGKGGIRVNFLINYSWEWDLKADKTITYYNSADISRIDLIIRWGGMRRLSGFLPVQSVYADFYVVDSLWPNYKNQDIDDALIWYDKQDVTLGG